MGCCLARSRPAIPAGRAPEFAAERMWPRPGPVENNSFRHGRAFHVAGAKPVQPLSKHSFEPVRCRLLLSLRDDMRRREFIAGLGATAIVWPRGALGQTRPAVRRIGILMNVAASDPEGLSRVAAFPQGMERLGWSLGRNLRIEYRWATNASERRNFAEELVALSPDAIVAGGASVLEPLQQATRTIPIVFLQVTDPVGAGFVSSLARPGGNTTGFSLFEFTLSVK